MDDVGERWRGAFWRVVSDYDTAQRLRDAAVAERLSDWTRELTSVVVSTCQAMGWQASAKRNALDFLPVRRQEYLALDVMAFPTDTRRWRFPVAVAELENKQPDDVIAYSLWKVLCVRDVLRVVFCYRRLAEHHAALLRHLSDEVVGSLGVERRPKLTGQTLVVIGTRGEHSTFPYGFFKWWELDRQSGQFILCR
jgi:hypothetical protein